MIKLLFRIFSGVRFCNPKRNLVAIIYNDDYWIKTLILKEMPSTTLRVYPDSVIIYITPILFLRFLLRMRFIEWFIRPNRVGINYLLRQAYMQYILACLDQMQTRVVLTFIDNAGIFHNLSRLDRKRTYFAIQNGTRTLHCVRDSLKMQSGTPSTISMTNFFCFGQRDIDLFVNYGHMIDNYLPIGSLVGGYYKSEVAIPNKEPQFDLCLISQWHKHFFEEITGDDYSAQIAKRIGAGIQGMVRFLQRFLKEVGSTMIVCPRNDSDEDEMYFYRNTFGEDVKLIESDRKNFSSYRAIGNSKLVIALNSTVLLEAFSWGQKVLWCNITDDVHYEMPEAGISYFHGADYDEFKSRVLMILRMSPEKYQMQTNDCAAYINSFNPLHPPHKIIRTAVIEAISS